MLSFGLKTTSVQESMHSSMKNKLGKRVIQVSDMPAFLDEWNKNRSIVIDYEVDLRDFKTAVLDKDIVDMGCAAISTSISTFVKGECRPFILKIVKRGRGLISMWSQWPRVFNWMIY